MCLGRDVLVDPRRALVDLASYSRGATGIWRRPSDTVMINDTFFLASFAMLLLDSVLNGHWTP